MHPNWLALYEWSLDYAAERGSWLRSLARLEARDVDFAELPSPPPGCWSVVIEDAWDWYRSSPLVRVLEVPGP